MSEGVMREGVSEGVMSEGVMSEGVMSVGVMSVGVRYDPPIHSWWRRCHRPSRWRNFSSPLDHSMK